MKAELLLSLHKGEKLLLLPNIWDPIGARILEAKGFPAIATASAAVSSSLGYKDGEKIKFSIHLEIVRRIVESVDIPVSADIESGYSANLTGLKENINLLIDTGAVGINIEDNTGTEGELRSIDEQCKRISAVRETAEKRGIHLVINARTDCFLSKTNKISEELINDAVKRANAFINAGADCIYPIGVLNFETVKTLRKKIKSPMNILGSARSVPLKTLQEIGINRVSFGPFVFRSCLKKFSDIVDELAELGSYDSFGSNTFSFDEAAKFLREEPG
ncbi:MAG: isocitrate lyase/phosphoenolpyruvate mutase family protein [Ignavibacteriaceae bacterium]|nr:isocitrate lyase/phosphoenolpyruvate mutase family protein [Chlorobium sp.]MCW8824338.1 isocitrate lyase/phosphoenolpyruvate mutase family protein [Ignavibacteriaceae bacterium]MCW8961143.1 isocitrate lyase/phosphoenolpyruvate mutase family protein [Ignavibacteriaceae bacterium]MCW8996872.1 isocitrate lyase/phosphoenolpyruvate mutase family protein [Psychromonas sp.]MCW9096716.1 isocitrate lyase/phosphoenolpyruvate mutase family protein [Ignavibacteriaceae bacterium]